MYAYNPQREEWTIAKWKARNILQIAMKYKKLDMLKNILQI